MAEGIAYFEQVLQMMPEDRATLEFLCIAYEQVGERAKYRQAVVSLARVLLRERDYESARALLERFGPDDDPEVKTLALRLKAVTTPLPEMASANRPVAESVPASDALSRFADHALAVDAEVSLLEWLHDNKIVSTDVLERVSAQLRELAAPKGDFLISALAVLESENATIAEMAGSFIADGTSFPPVAIEAFPEALNLIRKIPESVVRTRGVVCFGAIAGELLVAMANPLDERLREELAKTLGASCHFFFAPNVSLASVLERAFPENRK